MSFRLEKKSNMAQNQGCAARMFAETIRQTKFIYTNIKQEDPQEKPAALKHEGFLQKQGPLWFGDSIFQALVLLTWRLRG